MEAMPGLETAQKLGLLEEEYHKINEILGRKPNFNELSIFAVMWSEHCCYKNSIVWLKTLPKDSPRMLAKAGEENAGIVDIGNGLGCAFKIESHNHPSALEPYQGAATGVGGINRDIFTMGARPIAQLNSLRFGNLTHEKSRWHLKGVVKGIGDYGNAFGIPTVGGEIYFDDCYAINPLVNAFSAGIVKKDKIAKATSYGVGNKVFIVGSGTGKDGIHGAAFASKDLTENSTKDLPAVQVGDPFMEKLLLEATLEVLDTGAVIGIQDMGAAGIICSTSEMSAKGEHGMLIWLDQVPMRQANMQPWEILLSESQERMLVIVKNGEEDKIINIFNKWDLNCAQIGVVTDTQRLHFYHAVPIEYHSYMHDMLAGKFDKIPFENIEKYRVADVPCHDLVLGGGAPVYHREYKEPAYIMAHNLFNINTIPLPDDYIEIAHFLLAQPNIASKKWISTQYDSMVGTVNMTTNKPSDAAVIKIKGTSKALLINVDCNGRYVHANPEQGCAIAVAEAARNIVCSGGEPLAITNNLNFGNPYNPEVYWQFVQAVKGMKKACEKFGTPVTGGNVSFYNQSKIDGVELPVFPTPTIGMLGIMEDTANHMTLDFKNEGDYIYLIGAPQNDISSSEYLYNYLKIKQSPAPNFDLDEEYTMQNALKILIKNKIIVSAHDVSDGGLWIALMESAMPRNLGFEIYTDSEYRKDAFLFGESQSRVLVSVQPSQVEAFTRYFEKMHTDYTYLGIVTGIRAVIDDESYGAVPDMKLTYEYAIEDLLYQD
ncbi:MAG: phosphoribosylformylglycinamidine synthase subunit PurL [Cytophagales bacterium]|nr:phosphoribosylformylglycinamidine synthase subunit PurL [Cytophagales bacterium]